MNAVDWLLRPEHDDRPALITLQATHTHGELREAAEGFGAWLIAMGAQPGDCVAIVADSSFFSIACWLGSLRAGCVAIPLAPSVAAESWKFIVASTGLRFACLQKCSPALTDPLPLRARLVTETGCADQRAIDFADAIARPKPRWPELAADALAMVLFTSGSTGLPRGVKLAHKNLEANARGIILSVRLQADDRAMLVLPVCYSFGVSLVTTHLCLGACLVIDPRFMFPDKVLERIQETECTGFAGVPSHFQSLLRRSRIKSMRFPSLRWVQQAGGRLAPALVEELRLVLPRVRIHVMYGATENTARITCLPPEQLGERPGSVGLPIGGVKVIIEDEDGTPLPAGRVGRVVVQGDSVAAGYLGDPEATATVFREGRLYTSDLGKLDDDGYLTIVDRLGDFLKCGGTRTSVKVVEDAILHCPDVVEVAVLGVPDELLGEAVAALVVPRPGSHARLPEQILRLTKEKLPLPLQPRVVRLVETLPRSAAGKVQRPALKELLG